MDGECMNCGQPGNWCRCGELEPEETKMSRDVIEEQSGGTLESRLIRPNPNAPKKGKKGKKQKKEKTRKPSVLDHHFRSMATPANLRPGDVVLRRARKNKKKPPKVHDVAYEIVAVKHHNGEVETDGYMHSPDHVTAIIRNWDGSDGEKVWMGREMCTTEELNVLRPLNRGE